MRRHDREVTDSDAIDRIIMDCDCCRLGLWDGGEVYIVPMNFGFEHNQYGRRFYFHSAQYGRKLEMIGAGTCAGFELDCCRALKPAEHACANSFAYSSVIGSGRVGQVSDPEEKKRALSLIMEHYRAEGEWEFEDKDLVHLCVLKLDVKKLACKQNK